MERRAGELDGSGDYLRHSAWYARVHILFTKKFWQTSGVYRNPGCWGRVNAAHLKF